MSSVREKKLIDQYGARGIKISKIDDERQRVFLDILDQVRSDMGVQEPVWVEFGGQETAIGGYPGSRLFTVHDEDLDLPKNFMRCLCVHEMRHVQINGIREAVHEMLGGGKRADLFLRRLAEKMCDRAEVKYAGREDALAYNRFLLEKQKSALGMKSDAEFFAYEDAHAKGAEHPAMRDRIIDIAEQPITDGEITRLAIKSSIPFRFKG